MFDIFYNDQKKTVYHIMEFIEGLSLKSFVEKEFLILNEGIKKTIMRQIFEAVTYLHSDDVGISHR